MERLNIYNPTSYLILDPRVTKLIVITAHALYPICFAYCTYLGEHREFLYYFSRGRTEVDMNTRLRSDTHTVIMKLLLPQVNGTPRAGRIQILDIEIETMTYIVYLSDKSVPRGSARRHEVKLNFTELVGYIPPRENTEE